MARRAVTAVAVPEAAATDDPWAAVVGQEHAVAQLRAAVAGPVHAYLFVGPAGSGKRTAARAFAAELLRGEATGEAAQRHVRLALAEVHPDLRVVEPQGQIFRRPEAEELVRLATRTPVEGDRKVVVAVGLDQLEGAEGMLLKVVEEPPPSTVFVLLAHDVTPELVTIASRSAIVEFRPLADDVVAGVLASEGVDATTAQAVAAASGGNLTRARLLASDERFALRQQLWASIPDRLDGTGAQVAMLVDEVQAVIEDSMTALAERHAAEAQEVQERIERYGQRGSGKRELDERHKREVRRHRADELRFGFATLLGAYRDALAAGDLSSEAVEAAVGATRLVHDATEALQRSPNETLLLQALFARLPRIPG